MSMEEHAPDVTLRKITPRRAQVLNLIRKGGSRRLIAVELTISPKTADRHCEDLREITGCHTRAEMAVWWDRNEARWEKLHGPGRPTK